ncbi:transcription factor Pcc1-domain-containing protein [Boletus edulis BED1]|uniref:Transcription factor Pcc1-domain-containing protein n=1 Tax=Boletus edulis BED1 TaxID=1328754 RepID=A0AAD4BV25_BOLED|nr:transcription factor Pcc1-domain-containing protein [Boletus edulis BED1]
MSNTAWHTVTVRIPFTSNKHATIAKQVIEVDAERQKNAVKRTLVVEGDDLIATFQTLTVRLARISINGFLESIDLVIRTIGEFGEVAEQKATVTQMSEPKVEAK